MLTKQMALAAVLFTAVGFAPEAAGPDTDGTVSSCVTVVTSEVCTWAVMQDGRAVELGVTIPMVLIEAVPADPEMVWPPRELATVPFPAVVRDALGIDHLGLNWEAHGHPPATFTTPHFDFHLYSITQDAVRAIDCADESKPGALPAPYTLPDIDVPGMGEFIGLCVPAMGMHAMPDHEVHETDPFVASMLVGYYGAEPIFLEPMVSRELLLKRTGFSLPVPAVAGLPKGVHYPRAFRAEFDASTDAYRLVFSGFDAEQ